MDLSPLPSPTVPGRAALATLALGVAALLDDSGARGRCRTLRAPGTLRRALEDAGRDDLVDEVELEHALSMLKGTLRSESDVARFLCLEAAESGVLVRAVRSMGSEAGNFGAEGLMGDCMTPVTALEDSVALKQHNEVFHALLTLFDQVEKRFPENGALADSVLDILARVIAAGVTVENLVVLLRRAAVALAKKDSRTQLAFLHALEKGSRGIETSPLEKHNVVLDRAVGLALHRIDLENGPSSPETRWSTGSDYDEAKKIPKPEPGYFCFGGGDAGISFEANRPWPFAREYAAFFWIRVEEGCNPSKILKLETKSGHGITVSVNGDDVIGYAVQCESKDEKNEGTLRIRVPADKFKSRRWHQIYLHHYMRMMGQSVIRLFIDGAELKQASGYNYQLYFPARISEALFSCVIFEDFDGEAGPFYLFTEAVSQAGIASLSHLHTSRSHSAKSASLQVPLGQGLLASLAEKNLEQKVFLHASPENVVDQTCIDPYGSAHGELGKNSWVWNLYKIKDLVEHVGGIASLLPFVWKQPSRKTPRSFALAESLRLCDGASVIAVVSLLSELVSGCPTNQSHFRAIEGPTLLASALERLPRTVVRSSCDQFLVEGDVASDDEDLMIPAPTERMSPLVGALFKLADSAQDDKGLQDRIERDLIFNLKIFSRCSGIDNQVTVTQMQWLDALYEKARSGENRTTPIQHWVDQIRLFYKDFFSADGAFEREMETEDYAKLRFVLDFYSCNFVRIGCALLRESVQSDDLRVLLAGLLGTTHELNDFDDTALRSLEPDSPIYTALVGSAFFESSEHVEEQKLQSFSSSKYGPEWTIVDIYIARDVVRILNTLLALPMAPKGLYEHCARLDAGNGIASSLTVNVIGAPQIGDELRALCLKTITEYLNRVGDAVPALESIAKVKMAAKDDSRLPRGVQVFYLSGGYSSLLHSLSTALEDESDTEVVAKKDQSMTYQALLDMLIRFETSENSDPKISILPGEPDSLTKSLLLSVPGHDSLLDDSHLIHNPHALMLIVKLLPRMNSFLQQRVCQDLFLLLKFQITNRETFVKVPGWSASLLNVLGVLSKDSIQGSQVSFDLCRKLLVLLVHFAVCCRPQAWNEIENILALQGTAVGGDGIVRNVLLDTFRLIVENLKSSDLDPESLAQTWKNLQRIILMLDMYLACMSGSQAEEDVIQISNVCLEAIDILCCLPFEFPRSREGEGADALVEFSWQIPEKDQGDLDRLRGPPILALISLSGACLSARYLDDSCFLHHCQRLHKLVPILRMLPSARSLVRWTTLRGRRIKGEKSAFVLWTVDRIHRVLHDYRSDPRGRRQALPSVLKLLQVICKLYDELLALNCKDEFYCSKINSIKNPDDVEEWLGVGVLAQSLVAGGSSRNDSTGFRGAIDAIIEFQQGLKQVMEARLKACWEDHTKLEMQIQNTNLRARKDNMAIAFRQKLAYSEINRVSAKSLDLQEKNHDIVAFWRRVCVEVENENSIWYPQEVKQDLRWMLSDHEDAMRCRRLFQRNHAFNDHSDAVYRESLAFGNQKKPAQEDKVSEEPTRHGVQNGVALGKGQEMVKIGQVCNSDVLFAWRFLGGRMEKEADLSWFLWNGGKLAPPHVKNSLKKRPSSVLRKKELKVAPPGSPMSPENLFSALSPTEKDSNLHMTIGLPRIQDVELQSDGTPSSLASSRRPPRLDSSWKEKDRESSSTSLLGEVDDWALRGWEVSRREQFVLSKGEELVHVCTNAQWITPLEVTRGRLELSSAHLYFYADNVKADSEDNVDILGTPHGVEEDQQQRWVDDLDTVNDLGMNDSFQSVPTMSKSRLRKDKSMMKWSLSDLTEIHGRRYLLRETALELFFADKTNAFMCFPSGKARADFFKMVLKQSPEKLPRTFKESLNPSTVYERSGLQERWRRREISNFEYIMQLNTIAGRTYNDITQYPVFPWILRDYESEELDLENPRIFRDLSKPIGALNEERLREFIERYESFCDASLDIPPFHYGSHYSNAGIVLHYLLRVEPFTTLAIELQGGRFDCPDRLFFSVQDCWLSSMESMSDVKELIPEFFYCAELFSNDNEFNFGKHQDTGMNVEGVILPPWAKNSPHEFVRLHREALESEYVSQHLHEWVDLVFGYKQRGEPAVMAHNVFYYLTYEGAVDLDSIIDPALRHSIETQIAHFGQTPSQLLTKPHPERMRRPPSSVLRNPNFVAKSSVFSVWSEATNKESLVLPNALASLPRSPSSGAPSRRRSISMLLKTVRSGINHESAPTDSRSNTGSEVIVRDPAVVLISTFKDRVVVIHEDLSFAIHRVQNRSYEPKISQTKMLTSALISMSPFLRLKQPEEWLKYSSMRLGENSFVCAKQGKLIISGNYLDWSLRAQNVDNQRLEGAAIAHNGRVLCVSLCEKEEVIATGGMDCRVVAWHLGGASDIRDEMMELFGGGDHHKSSAAFSGSSPKGISTSQKRDISNNTASNGILLPHHAMLGHESPVTAVVVSSLLAVVVSGSAEGKVLLHTLHDGQLLRTVLPAIHAPISKLLLGKHTGNLIIHSSSSGDCIVMSMNGKTLARRTDLHHVSAMTLHYADGAASEETLLAGTFSGDVLLIPTAHLVTKATLQTTELCPVRKLAVNPDTTAIVAGMDNGKLAVIS